MNQVAFLHVHPPAQVRPPEAAAIKGVLEAPLDPFGPQLEGVFGDPRTQSRPVAVHRAAGLVVTLPAQHVPGLRFAGYLSALLRGREPRHLGHNPAGAVMMLVLMLLLAGVSVTGWLQSLDAFWGVAWVQDGHRIIADAILWLALLHAGAALWESARHRENLVLSRITGRKRSLRGHPG